MRTSDCGQMTGNYEAAGAANGTLGAGSKLVETDLLDDAGVAGSWPMSEDRPTAWPAMGPKLLSLPIRLQRAPCGCQDAQNLRLSARFGKPSRSVDFAH